MDDGGQTDYVPSVDVRIGAMRLTHPLRQGAKRNWLHDSSSALLSSPLSFIFKMRWRPAYACKVRADAHLRCRVSFLLTRPKYAEHHVSASELARALFSLLPALGRLQGLPQGHNLRDHSFPSVRPSRRGVERGSPVPSSQSGYGGPER